MLLVICCRGDKVKRWGVELNFDLNKIGKLPHDFIAAFRYRKTVTFFLLTGTCSVEHSNPFERAALMASTPSYS